MKQPSSKSTVSRYAIGSLRLPEDKTIGQVARAMLKDPMVKIGDWTLRALIESAGTTVLVQSGDSRGQILQQAFQNLWDNHVHEMLNCISDGRAAFEKEEQYSKDYNISYIKELIFLEYEHTEYKAGKDGSFEGIELKNTLVPADQAWWLALGATMIRPQGVSLFEGAPENVWRERCTVRQLRIDAFIRFVVNNGAWAIPFELETEDGQYVDEVAAFSAALDALRSGGTLLVSNKQQRVGGANGQAEWMDAYRQIAKPEIHDPAPINDGLKVLDDEMLLSLGVTPSAVTQAEVGSFAKTSVQMSVTYAVCEYILNQIERSFRKNVCIPCLEKNFGVGQAGVTVSHVPLKKQNQIQAGQNPNDPKNNPLNGNEDEQADQGKDTTRVREEEEIPQNPQTIRQPALTVRTA